MVVEVNHCDRRKRRNNGKTDTIDAEMAARSVLAGIATAVPKSADGAAEMVRQIKIARDTAVKARSSAIITLKTLIVNAPAELRKALEPLTDRKLIECCWSQVINDCKARLRFFEEKLNYTPDRDSFLEHLNSTYHKYLADLFTAKSETDEVEEDASEINA